MKHKINVAEELLNDMVLPKEIRVAYDRNGRRVYDGYYKSSKTGHRFAKRAYVNYKAAMKRRRSYVLDRSKFINLLLNEYGDSRTIFTLGRSCLHSFTQCGINFISHMAPDSHREMVSLLTQINKSELVVFAVTEDLVGMLEKIGYVNTGFKSEQSFGGEPVMKYVLVSEALAHNEDRLAMLGHLMLG